MHNAALSEAILRTAEEFNPALISLLETPDGEHSDLMRRFWNQAATRERELREGGTDPLECSTLAQEEVLASVRAWRPSPD